MKTLMVCFSLTAILGAFPVFAQINPELVKLAENGNADSQYDLGLIYYNGDGVDKNYRKAKDWLGKAASQGLSEAQAVLDIMYHEDLWQKTFMAVQYAVQASSAHSKNINR